MKKLLLLALTSTLALSQLQPFAGIDDLFRDLDKAFKDAEERMARIVEESQQQIEQMMVSKRSAQPVIQESSTPDALILKFAAPEGYENPEFSVVVDEKNAAHPTKTLEIILKQKEATKKTGPDDSVTTQETNYQSYSYASSVGARTTQRSTTVQVIDGVFTLRRTLPQEIDEDSYSVEMSGSEATITFKFKPEAPTKKRIPLTITKNSTPKKSQTRKARCESCSKRAGNDSTDNALDESIEDTDLAAK